jgi:poly(3-hydroxybutyrate) depolymerase
VRRTLAVALLAVVAVAAWVPIHQARRGEHDTPGTRVMRFALQSRLLHRQLHEILVLPGGRAQRRSLLVFLHGRSSGPEDLLSDALFKGLSALGPNAPAVLLADGGDHSYWHDRSDGPWGSYVLREAIPAALARSGGDPSRVAVGGVSMGGFGALDLARIAPHRFCAVGGHSAALWLQGGDTPAGAFDDGSDFARHDVIAAARSRSPYRAPVWLDVGTNDPFRAADTAFARELRADHARVAFHVWPGAHGPTYWRRHMAAYLRFYAGACPGS